MKKGKHASRKAKLFPTFPVPAGALPGTLATDPDDEIVALANSASPNFTPPKKAIPAMSRQEFLRLPVEERGKILAAQAEVMVAYYRDDPEVQAWQTNLSSKTETPDPLTLKAAAIVTPVLRAKTVTPEIIQAMLEEVLKVRKELHSKSNHTDLVESQRKIPKEPNLDVSLATLKARRRRERAARLKVLDELAKQAQELQMGYDADDPTKPNARLRHASGLTPEQKLKLEQAGFKFGTGNEFLCFLKNARKQPNFRATIPAERREPFLRLINAYGCTNAVGIQSFPRGKGSWSYSFYAPPAAIGSIADSLTRGGVRQFSHVPHRRKRVLLPEFKKTTSKKTVGNTQADLDAVRGDR
jgi:hypothetical protein